MESYEVRSSSIEGRGLFATRRIRAGEPLFTVSGPTIRYTFEPDYRGGANWLQLRENVWRMPLRGAPWNFINHSCRSNAGMCGTDQVVCVAPIRKGEEITIDYSTVEAGRYWKMACYCGNASCRKTIRGVSSLSLPDFLKHESYISPYLKKIFLCEKTLMVRERGRRLFAKLPIAKGEVIFRVEGPMVRYPFPPDYRIGYRWLSIGINTWVIPLRTNPWFFICHSCEPNVGVNNRREVVAMRALKPGEEIVIDDAMTEADPRWKHRCSCGAKTCRGMIFGVQSLDRRRFLRYAPYLQTHIRKAYEAQMGARGA